MIGQTSPETLVSYQKLTPGKNTKAFIQHYNREWSLQSQILQCLLSILVLALGGKRRKNPYHASTSLRGRDTSPRWSLNVQTYWFLFEWDDSFRNNVFRDRRNKARTPPPPPSRQHFNHDSPDTVVNCSGTQKCFMVTKNKKRDVKTITL